MGIFALTTIGCRADLDADGLGIDANAKATRTVCAGSGDHNTITDAINAAADGDVIEVCPGTYSEALVIDDLNLTLVSTDGAGSTTLQGSGSGTVIDISGRDTAVTVEGFTIQGGYNLSQGGGVNCYKSEVTLTDNVIRANAGYNGAGFYETRCTITVTGNTFSLNSAIERGGGAYLYRGDGVFTDNVFDDNSARRGGGAYISKANDVVADDNLWTNNSATQYGGGTYATGSPQLSGNTWDSNSSNGNGGAVYLYKPEATGTFDSNVLTNNYAPGDGGALYARWMAMDVTNNVFSGNYSSDDGGAARLHRATGTFGGNVVTNNYGRDDGGGVKSCHGYTNYENNLYDSNQAGDQGGGLEVDNEGGSIYGSTYTNNIASHGGGLHMWDNLNAQEVVNITATGNSVVRWGGAVEIEDNPYVVSFRNSVLSNNSAEDGGGLSVTRYASFELENVIITGNSATDRAGAFYVRKSSTGTIANTVMTGNSGVESAAIDSNDCAGIEIYNLIVSENTGGDAVKFRGDLPAVWAYNNVWGNDEAYGWAMGDRTGIDGNIAEDPEFTNVNGGDYSLSSGSASIDAGDPNISDTDGSRSDQGAYGGPGGDW